MYVAVIWLSSCSIIDKIQIESSQISLCDFDQFYQFSYYAQNVVAQAKVKGKSLGAKFGLCHSKVVIPSSLVHLWIDVDDLIFSFEVSST